MRRIPLIVAFVVVGLAVAVTAGAEKKSDKPDDAARDVKARKLAELVSLKYVFEGPDYLLLDLKVGQDFPEEGPPELTYTFEFGLDPMAAANEKGEWKGDWTVIFRPYGERPKCVMEGKPGRIEPRVIYAEVKGQHATINLNMPGLDGEWMSRLRVRSRLGDGPVADELTDVWVFANDVERPGALPPEKLPPEDEIAPGDEAGRMLTGLFEFTLDDRRGLLRITRHGGKYHAVFAWYSGEVTEGPLYVLGMKKHPKNKQRKGHTIASFDVAFKAYYGAIGRGGCRPQPTMIRIPKFNGRKMKVTLPYKYMAYERGHLLVMDETRTLELVRVDDDTRRYPGRKEYLEKLLEERFVNDARTAYRTALALYNCIASEDWNPGYELGRMGGYENKQYIARRALKMSALADLLPDADKAIRDRALQLRWRLFNDPNVIPVLKNENVALALRMPVLVYIFPKTDAKLDWMRMKAEFTPDDIERIKRGLEMGAEQLFQETFGYFTPVFDYYHEKPWAKELPPVDAMGRGEVFLGKQEPGDNTYYLLLERMMRYTICKNSYEEYSDYLPAEKFEKMGLAYPVVFVIGKVDSKSFQQMVMTRAQSEKEFKGAKLAKGLAFTKGWERGRPAYCHIVLDEGFKAEELKEIVLWSIVMIAIENTNRLRGDLRMKFLQEGCELLPDPYKDIKRFKAKLASAEWWNAYENVYISYGLKKLLCCGRRPYFRKQALEHPQLLVEMFRLNELKRLLPRLMRLRN